MWQSLESLSVNYCSPNQVYGRSSLSVLSPNQPRPSKLVCRSSPLPDAPIYTPAEEELQEPISPQKVACTLACNAMIAGVAGGFQQRSFRGEDFRRTQGDSSPAGDHDRERAISAGGHSGKRAVPLYIDRNSRFTSVCLFVVSISRDT